MWTPWDGPGLEHLHLAAGAMGVTAESLVIGLAETQPFRIRYTIRCDAGWTVRAVDVDTIGPDAKGVHLRSDGHGHWTNASGEAIRDLDGCVDIDISATPFTNTLPIRRLRLRPGDVAELLVVYVDVPDLEVLAVRQRYTCIASTPKGTQYRYESLPYEALPDGFEAELPVDQDGLVKDYPGLFRRVWSD